MKIINLRIKSKLLLPSQMTIPDDELLQRLSAGDPVAFEMFIRTHYAVICRFSEKFLPDAALAQDVAQESFIKLWKSGKTFDTLTALKAYLYTIARNGCLDLIRNRNRLQQRHYQAAAGEETAMEPVLADIIRAESIALIYQFVQEMPGKMRDVFLLSYREGMTVSEIAVQLGWKVKAVKKQKYKALVALRGRFGHHTNLLLPLLSAVATWTASEFGK
jgi:RNA polymerase sigma-70 factor (family 1)